MLATLGSVVPYPILKLRHETISVKKLIMGCVDAGRMIASVGSIKFR
jgi:hypothetical protein